MTNSLIFSGDRKLLGLHECFLTSNSIYLVVFDLTKVRETLKELDTWIKQLTISKKGKIFLVGTHLDELQSRKEELHDLKKDLLTRYSSVCYPAIEQAIYAISNKTREGYFELQQAIEQVAIELQEAQLLSPQWMRVHNILKEKCEKKFIYLELYNKITKAHGISDKSERIIMTNFLIDIGALIYFPDHDCDLREMIFLDPEWLYHSISYWFHKHSGMSIESSNPNTLSDAIKIAQLFGIIFIDKKLDQVIIPYTLPMSIPAILPSIWDSFLQSLDQAANDPSYHPLRSSINYDHYSINTPLQFNSSTFSFPTKSLTHSTPTGNEDYKFFEHGIRFDFSYLPPGLFPKFITKCMNLVDIDILTYWRYGLIFKKNHQIAIILCSCNNDAFSPTYKPSYKSNSFSPVDSIEIRCRFTEEHMKVLFQNLGFLLFQLVDLLNNLIECYFQHLIVSRWVPCYHCISEEKDIEGIYYFHTDKLHTLQNHENKVYCKYPHFSENTTPALWINLLIHTKKRMEIIDNSIINLPTASIIYGKNIQISMKSVDCGNYLRFNSVRNSTVKLPSSFLQIDIHKPNDYYQLLGEYRVKLHNDIIKSIGIINKNLLWIGTTKGFIGIYQLCNEQHEEVEKIKTRRIHYWYAHEGPITSMISVRCAKSDKLVWSSSSDGSIHIWHSQTYMKQTSVFHNKEILKLIVTGNNTQDAKVWSISSHDHRIRIWNACDYTVESVPILYNKNISLPLNNIVKHNDLVLVSAGYIVFAISIANLEIIGHWQVENQNFIRGICSVSDGNVSYADKNSENRGDLLCSWNTKDRFVRLWESRLHNPNLSNFFESPIFPPYSVDDLPSLSIYKYSFEFIHHSSTISIVFPYRLRSGQIILLTCSHDCSIIFWEIESLTPLFKVSLSFDSSEYVKSITSAEDLIIIATISDPKTETSSQITKLYFLKPTAYFNERIVIDYQKLAEILQTHPDNLFSIIAPG